MKSKATATVRVNEQVKDLSTDLITFLGNRPADISLVALLDAAVRIYQYQNQCTVIEAINGILFTLGAIKKGEGADDE